MCFCSAFNKLSILGYVFLQTKNVLFDHVFFQWITPNHETTFISVTWLDLLCSFSEKQKNIY